MSFEDRSRAERAIEGYGASRSLEEIEALQWPPAGNRIREARARSGLSENEVATSVGITAGSYWDLEHNDDEAYNVATLRQLRELGQVLNVEPSVLLLGDAAGEATPAVTPPEISARLRDRMEDARITADQLGDSLGWNIQPLLADPEALWDYDVEALYTICKGVGLDWVSALPQLRDCRTSTF